MKRWEECAARAQNQKWYAVMDGDFIGMLMVFLVFVFSDVSLKAGSFNGAMMWGQGALHYYMAIQST